MLRYLRKSGNKRNKTLGCQHRWPVTLYWNVCVVSRVLSVMTRVWSGPGFIDIDRVSSQQSWGKVQMCSGAQETGVSPARPSQAERPSVSQLPSVTRGKYSAYFRVKDHIKCGKIRTLECVRLSFGIFQTKRWTGVCCCSEYPPLAPPLTRLAMCRTGQAARVWLQAAPPGTREAQHPHPVAVGRTLTTVSQKLSQLPSFRVHSK